MNSGNTFFLKISKQRYKMKKNEQKYSHFIIYKPIKDNCNSFSAIFKYNSENNLFLQIKLDLRKRNWMHILFSKPWKIISQRFIYYLRIRLAYSVSLFNNNNNNNNNNINNNSNDNDEKKILSI